MDFGAAHAFYTSRQRQTGPGAAPGKMSYLGPERAAGGLATPKSDQHSLGSVHLELLTLKSAFAVWVNSQLDHQATKARALSGVPIGGWDERTRGMRAELKTVVQTAMAKDPAHRHDSVADYRDALLKVAPAFDDAGVERMLARLFPEKVKGWKKLPAAPKKKWWKKLLGLLTVAVLLAPVVSLALPQQVEVITEAGETTHFVCPLGYHTSWTPPGDHIRGTCSKPSWVFAHCDTQTEYRGERSALIGPWKSTCVEENGRWTCRTSKPGAKHEQ
jgi:hypothetical protein